MLGGMPMRATTVRFSDDLWDLLEREADAQGTSAAQVVRDATIMRLAFLLARRGDPAAEATLADIAARRVRRQAAPELPPPNPGRIAALRRAGLLDTAPEPEFDRLTSLASRVLNAPVALVSLVDEDRQFFKSCLGLAEPWSSARETPLSHSFCQYAVASKEPLIIGDAREDAVLKHNLAVRDLDIIAYAGIPLITSDGEALGTLCVADSKPRVWTRDQAALLSDLAATVVQEIESRRRPDSQAR